MFAWKLGLSPTEYSAPLNTGIIGHRVQSAYYKAKMDGYNKEECIQAGMLELSKYMGGQYSDVISLITNRFLAYVMYYVHDPVEILAVEEPFTVQLTSDIAYGFQPDVVVQYIGGPFVGSIAVWDHKWTYNFWTDNEVHFTSQLPKYMWGLRQLGYDVRHGFINQVRTREIKDPASYQLFRRARTEPTEQRIENIMKVQLEMAEEITRLPDNSTWFSKAPHSISRMNCKECFFRDPCNLMLEGRDPEQMLRVNYTQNSTAPVYKTSEELMERTINGLTKL
jgi:hypothetical protein